LAKVENHTFPGFDEYSCCRLNVAGRKVVRQTVGVTENTVNMKNLTTDLTLEYTVTDGLVRFSVNNKYLFS
jgi:hypothetical protein